ncbi:restriction endonuclease subunit S [Rhodoferax ferrireducens]|uniref:restriction endonuclease subunit S n=1 Tax=Rhodoferax ferrireducens TaxID=192843 RepID=UPI000E0D831A|nr:restriction endonuclease subunit S [Rhodoferax ferrireducens]
MRKEKLSSLCKVSNGFAFKSDDYVSHGYRVMRITNVQKGLVVDNAPKFIPQEIADKANGFKLGTGDILISLTGNVGRVGVIQPQHLPAVLNQRVGLIRPSSEEINEKYLFQYLNSDNFEREAIKNSNGVAQLNLSSKWIESHEIPLPTLNDQIRIAHLLGKVEGLLAQRKQHLQQLDDLLKSVFLEMFGPTSPDYEIWPLVEIRELAAKHKGAMRTGPFGSNLLHSEFTSEGDVAVLGIDNAVQNRFAWGERRFISNEKYQELQSYRIFSGDVIVTIMGTIGRSAVIPDDIPVAINTKHLAAITLNREVANPLFLSYSIHSSPFVLTQFASKNRGAIMSGLNLGIIKETKIKRPPIGLQNRFAEIHARVDQLKSRYQKSLADLEVLYGVLSQNAFKGELDLLRVSLPKEVTQPMPVDAPMPSAEVITPTELVRQLVQSAEPLARDVLLAQWFRRYLANTPPATGLRSAQMLEDAWQALQTAPLHAEVEEEEDESPMLSLADYDVLKALVFKALDAGELLQTFDDDRNRVALTSQSAEWGTW